MTKFKKLFTALIVCICLIGVLFSTGCSEGDVDKVVEIASIIAESGGQETASATEQGGQTQNDQQSSAPGQDLKETQVPEQQAETEGYSQPVPTTTPQQNETPEQIFADPEAETDTTAPPLTEQIPEDGEYLSMEQVSSYLHLYGHLPGNYLTKKEAQKKGWVASKGNLWDVAPGAAIGGDTFGNREKLLPMQKGRKYYECDVNYEGGRRGAERLVYSNDGLIYYTADHYENFMLIFDGSED